MSNAAVIALSLLLFGISCFATAFTLDGVTHVKGWHCVVIGWLAIVSDPLIAVIWSANVFYLKGLYLYARSSLSGSDSHSDVVLLCTATALAVSFIFKKSCNGDLLSEITERNTGYYLWLSSFALITLFRLKQVLWSS